MAPAGSTVRAHARCSPLRIPRRPTCAIGMNVAKGATPMPKRAPATTASASTSAPPRFPLPCMESPSTPCCAKPATCAHTCAPPTPTSPSALAVTRAGAAGMQGSAHSAAMSACPRRAPCVPPR
ncbi:hypothetical protein G6F61_014298 [Rhizopus arrhizus]|nr:hypothetical protein G6F66_015058 [Rhizopus arrhizus]KAG1361578.1 hypothetical protein G6F61_014298 [Rhizopus arrhizus]